MKADLQLIDLRPEEKGSLCVLCEVLPAELRDPDVGPVCCVDFGYLARAGRILTGFAMLEEEGR